MSKIRDARINRMSEAFRRLSEVSTTLGEKAETLASLAPEVDRLKTYIVSGQWLKDFEADEKGEIGPSVDRSVLSEDGLYNLLSDLEDLMHTFERILDLYAADPELDKLIESDQFVN